MVLFFINIMPVPGFDGFNIVQEFIHLRIDSQRKAEIANTFFFILAMIFFICIDRISEFSAKLVFRLLQMIITSLGLNQ